MLRIVRKTCHSRFALGLLLLLNTAVQVVEGQGFDTSGNGTLHGGYFVRQIACSRIASNGTNGRARSLSGVLTFDGAGAYSFNGQVMDTDSGSAQPAPYAMSGTYGVASNALVQLTSPLDSQLTMSGALGVSALIASSPTGSSVDVLIAIPVSTSPLSQSTLQGTYWFGLMDFLHGKSLLLRNGFASMTAAGTGVFNDFAISGNAVNLGVTGVGQAVSGATYSVSGNGSGTASFPVPAGSPVESRLISGNKTLYVSSDGNLLLGGASDGYDILVGVKALPAPVDNSSVKSLYYLGGVQVDFAPLRSGGVVDWSSNSGSFNASGTGVSIWHQRLHVPDAPALDSTFDFSYSLSSNGSVSGSSVRYAVGAGGSAFLLTGNSDTYAFTLAVRAPSFTGSGVYLNPAGITNAASYAPITNSIAPGEIVSLYGSGLAPSPATASGAPYPPSVGGVSVSMNGLPAPIYDVGPGRIDAIVPFAAADTSPYITVQVNNNGTLSNPVMVYANSTAPGIFTLGESGVGDGCILHLDYSVVSASNPAHAGEIVQVFLTGLGKVSPAVPDGAPGAGNPLSTAVSTVGVFINNQPANVLYKGLAPLYPGLYQINVRVPSQAGTGDVYLDISTPVSYHSQARIFLAP